MLPAVLLAASLSVAPDKGQPAAPGVELVSAKTIWADAPSNTSTDIVRFKDRWFVVCREGTDEYSHDGTLRVLSSADAEKWDAVARIVSPTPGRGLGKPRFTLTPDGELTVSAVGIVPTPNVPDPLPRYGGTVQTMTWFSKDGKAWERPDMIGPTDYPFDRVVWHKGTALGYGRGCICGSMQTVQIFGSDTGREFKSIYKQTFSGFFPESAALVIDGDTAHCLMSRAGVTDRNPPVGAMLGTAKAPFTKWDWTEIDTKAVSPNLLRLADGRIIAAVGLADGKARTAVCQLDPATGKLTELFVLPTDGVMQHAGLAHHDGHLWATFHAVEKGRQSVRLAKLKMK